MNIDNFVLKLRKLKPSRESFERLGYPPDLIEKRTMAYECLQLRSKKKSNVSNEILDLLYSYDCSNIEIGIVSFTNNVQEEENFFIIGSAESDLLTLSKITLEVNVVDCQDLDWIIWPCASNGEFFLNAILLAAEFFSMRVDNPSLSDNHKFTHKYVLQCVDAAGGDKYEEFYKTLLGDYT